MTSALISAAELKNLSQARVLDASYNVPPSAMGIPGALDFDIDDVADAQSPFAHTVPPAEVFARKVGAMGIGNDDPVVVYDRNGIAMAAARAWWMFRLFGHDDVRVLDGGLPAWEKSGGMIGAKAPQYNIAAECGGVESASVTSVPFKAHFRPELLKTFGQMADNATRGTFAVYDARDAARFRNGHIPGAVSLHYAGLINPDGTLKPKDALAEIFTALPERIASSCGSGVTACVIALALYELGRGDVAVYDGSWTEWNAQGALPKAEGF